MMATPRSSATGLESTWIGRTHFSRAICYRVEDCIAPRLSFIHETLLWKELVSNTPAMATFSVSKLKDENLANELEIQRLSSRHRRSLSDLASSEEAFPIAGREKQRVHTRSISLPRIGGSNDIKYEDNKESEVKRAISWSDYFATTGGEYAVEAAEEWMVDLSQLFLGQKFASGAYSRVYHGIYKDKAVAVKILRQPDDNEEVANRLDRQFRREVNVLSRLHHPNVVEFLGACRKPPVCCIIIEYLPQGSLRAFLHKHEPYSLPLTLVIGMALDIAQGMEYLHSQGVIHRDLKSENLVLADSLCVKITDFGVACFEADCPRMMEDLGTYRWMAPEMISKKIYSRKVDVYSFGIVLWEILTGQVPFQELSSVQAAFAVVHKNARPVIPHKCPNALGQLMQKCWSSNPDKRPEFSQVTEVLEKMKASFMVEMSFNAWQGPHKHTNMFLCCFTGCLSKSSLNPS